MTAQAWYNVERVRQPGSVVLAEVLPALREANAQRRQQMSAPSASLERGDGPITQRELAQALGAMLGPGGLAPWSIIIVDTWMWTPFVMLICLAGLRSIPDYIYEAAEIDRASKWRQFWTITVPMVLPFLMLAVLFRGIENFKMFDMVTLLTGGGPGNETLLTSIDLKREAFEKWRTGYSSAYAIILFVTVFGLASIYVKALNKVKER